MEEESSGQWLEKALGDLCKRIGNGLDSEMISGLVSYCDFADPRDAKEYLDNIIGEEAGKTVIEEYLRRRGHSGLYSPEQGVSSSQLHAYVKPPQSEKVKATVTGAVKKPPPPKSAAPTSTKVSVSPETTNSVSKTTKIINNNNNNNNSKKKKVGKVISLAEAAKGSVVFKQGKPCSCQARQHGLVSNCLSCGKIVCEQEGEGPCNFCGALVLMEGSEYAGLGESLPFVSDSEAAAEAYAKRLVDYDRNSAARTTVIDDQSDYYEIEGNSWLSKEEKELLRKKREEIEEEEKEKRRRVVVMFDLVGRKVLVNKDEVDELESETGILRPPDERELNRIKPNPTIQVQPVFVDPGPTKKNPAKSKRQPNKSVRNGLCLEITGRVQHESNELKHLMTSNEESEEDLKGKFWQAPSSSSSGVIKDDGECSLDYR